LPDAFSSSLSIEGEQDAHRKSSLAQGFSAAENCGTPDAAPDEYAPARKPTPYYFSIESQAMQNGREVILI
jgi:hypothetical protein